MVHRWRLALALLFGVSGCLALVDTSGLAGSVPAGGSDGGDEGAADGAERVDASDASDAALPVLQGTNAFGRGTPYPNGWQGTFYEVEPPVTTLPALGEKTPLGVLYASVINVSARSMDGGFPGIDPARNENFVIRWEAVLTAGIEGDYLLRLVSDDGAKVSVDGLVIVDNDGAHSVTSASASVHLIKGIHAFRVDYFNGLGDVALQLFCTRVGGVEGICTNPF